MCHTCDIRNAALTVSSAPRLIKVCLITLNFTTPATPNSKPYVSLNTLLNDITDAAEARSHPSTFTSWSPCLTDANVVVILTTASETCRDSTLPIFSPVLQHLSTPPHVQHIYLDFSVLSLAASSPEERIAVDIITICAPDPGVAGAIGKRFGWDPKRSTLSAQMGDVSTAFFSPPGDLIRDIWTWAELHPGVPASPSSSVGTGYESLETRPGLISTNSEEKNMSLFWAEDDERRNMEDETLVMIFQWSNHVDGDRFKHPLQKSYGHNGIEVNSDTWDRHVAHPVRQLQGTGAKINTFRLELRGVEARIHIPKTSNSRERSGSKRLSMMASGLGERVSGFWGR